MGATNLLDHIVDRFRVSNFLMLGALMFLVFADPFIPGKLLGFGITDLGIILVLGASLLSVAFHRLQVIVGISMFAIIIAMRFADVVSISWYYEVAYLVLVLTFLVYITVLMTREVLTTHTVTLDTVSESLAVYMLMGLTWAMAYQLLEVCVPGSFNFPPDRLEPGVSSIHRIINFSFVTITTLGYGNITPANPKADALCSAQALVGQIYVTVLVARLVALQIAHSNQEPPADST